MRVFDNLSTPASSSKPSRRKRGKASKNTTKGQVRMTPEQIRAKVQANSGKKLSLKEKLAKTKESSSFMSAESASRVTLNSINKQSQKFPNIKKEVQPPELPDNLIREEANSTDEIFEAQVEISEPEEIVEEGEELDPDRPGALQNDPASSITVNKLKEALNTGAFRVDAKTRKVLGEIISSRT
jgi:hypothetical protein